MLCGDEIPQRGGGRPAALRSSTRGASRRRWACGCGCAPAGGRARTAAAVAMVASPGRVRTRCPAGAPVELLRRTGGSGRRCRAPPGRSGVLALTARRTGRARPAGWRPWSGSCPAGPRGRPGGRPRRPGSGGRCAALPGRRLRGRRRSGRRQPPPAGRPHAGRRSSRRLRLRRRAAGDMGPRPPATPGRW